jgi:subtilisin family serine protease
VLTALRGAAFVAALLAAALWLALAPAGALAADSPSPVPDVEYVPGRLILHARPGEAVDPGVLRGAGVTARRPTLLPGVTVLDLPEHAVTAALTRLASSSSVAHVERDVVVRATAEPDDPRWPEQWGPKLIDLPDAWEHTTGSSSVVVAVLDTGLDPFHPEFSGRIREGWNTQTNTSLWQDDNVTHQGHGTQATGVLTARGDNGAGIAGACWECSILPVKVLNSLGLGNTTQLAEGILWAAENGADVINMSLGARAPTQLLTEAVGTATQAGAVLVAAAGNFENDNPVWPAAYPDVIGVAASDPTDTRYGFSSYGSWVDVAAPGCNVATTLGGGTTLSALSFCGTSAAAPLVAGTAALMLAHTPAATAAAVRAAITDTAVPVGGWVAHGRINAGAAVTKFVDSASPEPTPSPPPPAPPEDGCPRERVPDAGFDDIRGNTHEHAINCVVWYGIARGVSSDRYAPELDVTRAQMASFVARLVERSGRELDGSGDHFDDVSEHNPHRENINKLANAGIVSGTGPRTYQPGAPVRRDQMASFLVRAYEFAAGERLAASRNYFGDTAGNPHRDNINKAAEAGFASGFADGTYRPALAVRRDQMGSFIARTLDRLVARGHMQPQ